MDKQILGNQQNSGQIRNKYHVGSLGGRGCRTDPKQHGLLRKFCADLQNMCDDSPPAWKQLKHVLEVQVFNFVGGKYKRTTH